jgi:hypothetical protein
MPPTLWEWAQYILTLQILRTESCNTYLNRFEKGQHGWLKYLQSVRDAGYRLAIRK